MIVPFIPQATGFVLYTPSANILPHAYCTFYLDTDSTVTFTDKEGNVTTLASLKAGYQPILVTKIVTVTTGLVYLCTHNQLTA